MSLQSFYDDHHLPTTDAPVRVFPAVAATPRSPEPSRWTNPVAVMLVTMALAVGLTWIAWLPAFTGAVVMALGLALTVVYAIGYFSWPDSRDEAAAEAVWVARQSGYRISAHGDDLRWIDHNDTVKTASIARGPDGWDLVLTDQDATGGFSI